MIHHHPDLIQGTDEWLAARCGLLTASEMCRIITPGKLRPADNDKSRAHLWELLAQRITRHVEPAYISDDMLRGEQEEVLARDTYAERYAPVQQVGFITRDIAHDGIAFTLGYSPDGMVGDDGLIECKSRRQRFQVETIVTGEMPDEFQIQVQTGMIVSGRAWCDFISYSGGLPMVTIRVWPDPATQAAILDAAAAFERRLEEKHAEYRARLAGGGRLIPTERTAETEMHL